MPCQVTRKTEARLPNAAPDTKRLVAGSSRFLWLTGEHRPARVATSNFPCLPQEALMVTTEKPLVVALEEHYWDAEVATYYEGSDARQP